MPENEVMPPKKLKRNIGPENREQSKPILNTGTLVWMKWHEAQSILCVI